MQTKIVTRTSLFPASVAVIMPRLRRLETLQMIAYPYATFQPAEGTAPLCWKPGEKYSFEFRLFGCIPFGKHTIEVVRFDEEGIYTRESNPHVPVWNHRIILKAIGEASTEYTDEVEIGADWKTPFVCLWAKLFYRHRQRNWIKLLREDKGVAAPAEE